MSVFRSARGYLLLTAVLAVFSIQGAHAQWVSFENETSTRLSSLDPALGVNDVDEKDYAWGDVDQDGDVDLVVVRKQPFTSAGKRVSVLFLNENGVLTDRTSVYATDSDVPGDLGFNTPTNNRDVVLADVNGDTWLDVVTATTISDGDPKHIGHPRVYRNKGDNAQGEWQGFRFEDFRIPTMTSATGQPGFNPRFCSVAAGDVTGDGRPDLWFGDYDSSGAGGNSEPSGADFDDRLLINTGNGQFTDQTTSRFLGTISVPNSAAQPFRVSAFGAAAAIADMDGDGRKDIVKQTSLNSPLYVGMAYNNSGSIGFFDEYEAVYALSPYFVSVGDLNNDSRQDLVITDDGADRYLLNQGNGSDGLPNFNSSTFSYDAASDDGFGSQSVIADLNNDGWNDVLISDVDVDIGGCTRRLHIYRNLGGTPGGPVVLQEQTSGSGCSTGQGNPPTCFVAGIPANMLEGVHNVAVFDINNDGWKDLVVGRCTGTQVYVNAPPIGLTFSFPEGLPVFVPPDQPYDFEVQITGFGGIEHESNTGKMSVSIGGQPFDQFEMVHLGDGLYSATLPISACAQTVDFFFNAEATNGTNFADPQGAPIESYTSTAALGSVTAIEDDLEGDVSGWTVVNDPALTAGAWEQATPIGTLTGTGQQAAPSQDADAPAASTKAFVTQNGAPGGAAGASDVDGGPTTLISPVVDLAGTDGFVTFSRWFFSDGNDQLTVWVTNDGNNWTLVETVAGVQNSWQASSFKVGDFVTPTSTVRVRFRTLDAAPAGVTEAGIDAFRVERLVCQAATGSGRVPATLTVNKAPADEITLNWGASCSLADDDFEVYEGVVGDFTSHVSRLCTTSGATTTTLAPDPGDTYYLIVPTNGEQEGSYGLATTGERPASTASCLPQTLANCP